MKEQQPPLSVDLAVPDAEGLRGLTSTALSGDSAAPTEVDAPLARLLTVEEIIGALIASLNAREHRTPNEIIQRKFAEVNGIALA